jgi:hypothetical protein
VKRAATEGVKYRKQKQRGGDGVERILGRYAARDRSTGRQSMDGE